MPCIAISKSAGSTSFTLTSFTISDPFSSFPTFIELYIGRICRFNGFNLASYIVSFFHWKLLPSANNSLSFAFISQAPGVSFLPRVFANAMISAILVWCCIPSRAVLNLLVGGRNCIGFPPKLTLYFPSCVIAGHTPLKGGQFLSDSSCLWTHSPFIPTKNVFGVLSRSMAMPTISSFFHEIFSSAAEAFEPFSKNLGPHNLFRIPSAPNE